MTKRTTASLPASPSDRHEMFAQEYLIDLNATAAYLRVYGESIGRTGAAVSAHALLRNPKIARRIAELKADRLERLHLEQDRPLRQLLDIVESDLGNIIDAEGGLIAVASMDTRTRSAVKSVKVRRVSRADAARESITEVKFWDKVAACRLLMQHMGMLADRVEIAGPNGGPIVHQMSREERLDEMAEMMSAARKRMLAREAGAGTQLPTADARSGPPPARAQLAAVPARAGARIHKG